MKLVKTLTVLAAATLIGAGALSTSTNVSADKVSDAKSAVAKNQSSTNALITKLQDAQANVMKISNQISDKTVAIDDTQTKIEDTQTKITSYQAQIDKAAAEVKSRKAVLKKQLVSLQKQVGDSVTGNVYFDFVLNAKDFSDLISRGFTVNKLNQASQEALTAVQDAKDKEAALKQEQESKKSELVATKAKLEADKKQLNTLKDQATTETASLTKQINDNKAELTTLQSNVNSATAEAAAALVARAAAAKAATTQTTTTQNTAKATNVSNSISHVTSTVGNGSKSAFVSAALAQQGKPYVWAAAGPSAFDCSGLVVYAAQISGLGSLPHQASQLAQLGTRVSMSSLQPGDLLFWGAPAYHVAIYIGGGTYVHAPEPGQTVTTQSVGSWAPTQARRL